MTIISKLENDVKSFYLADDRNEVALWYTHDDIYERLEGLDIGSYEYIVYEEQLFQWMDRKVYIKPTQKFLDCPQAWVRDLKIKDIFKD